MASPTRRTVLKSMGVAAAVAIARPFRAGAQEAPPCPDGKTPCGPTCCTAGVACANKRKGICACPSGQHACGALCCPSGGACSDPQSGCCCNAGETPCGPTCCQAGVACLNPRKGVCGCPGNTVQCKKNGIVHCCPSGTPCTQFETCPEPGTALGCTGCKRYAENCTGDGDCCSGDCGNVKGPVCACASNAECGTGFICVSGFCFDNNT